MGKTDWTVSVTKSCISKQNIRKKKKLLKSKSDKELHHKTKYGKKLIEKWKW